MERIVKRFLAAIEQAQNIVISTHLIPDADGIGSQISLCLALKEIGKNAICCNEEPLLERYKYLDPDDVVTSTETFDQDYPHESDLIIVVDTNTINRTGAKFLRYATQAKAPILYIDHHPCSEFLKLQHCIDTKAAATGELIGELIESLNLTFTSKMALPLYTAILIDTSSFRYPSVTARTHEIVAKLMSTGIKPPQAYNGINGTKTLQHMHLLGKVLSSSNTNASGEVAWITLKAQELNDYDVDIEDTHGFINNLLILDGVKVACMFRDDGHRLKVSMRSTGEYDVGNIAQTLGGGGHSHSAATIIEKDPNEDLDNLIQNIIVAIEKALE